MKNILFIGIGGKEWMGGVTYMKNMIFQMTCIEKYTEKYSIFLLIPKENASFYDFANRNESISIIWGSCTVDSIISVCDNYGIDVVFPVTNLDELWMLKNNALCWIPDFQEIHFPELFDKKEILVRQNRNRYCAENHCALVLSSSDSLNDYRKQYPECCQGVFVVPFVAYIENDKMRLSDDYQYQIEKKYDFPRNYIYIPNQFWKHKNHITVLRALRILINEYNLDIHMVFTGNMKSYNTKKSSEYDQYSKTIIEYVKKEGLDSYVHFLGVISREEQLCIMKHAKLIIQPSLFEGWGCGVEEAKCMGKRIVLSDIPIHLEQMNDNCVLFKRNDARDLAKKISDEYRIGYIDRESEGIEYCEKKAHEYARKLENAIESLPGGRTNLRLLYDNERKHRIQRCIREFQGNVLGVYGVGKHSDNMVPILLEMRDEFEIFFFDRDLEKQKRLYYGHKVYDPNEIEQFGVTDLIISSRVYQNDIIKELQAMCLSAQIHRIYKNDDELLVHLFD